MEDQHRATFTCYCSSTGSYIHQDGHKTTMHELFAFIVLYLDVSAGKLLFSLEAMRYFYCAYHKSCNQQKVKDQKSSVVISARRVKDPHLSLTS